MPEQEVVISTIGEMTSVPKEKYAPEAKKKPGYLREIKNFADDEDLVKKTLAVVQSYYQQFISQGQRSDAIDSMKMADELYRAAVDRSMLKSKESRNVENTTSHVKSATYYADQRAIVANQKTMVLGVEETLPIKFEPIPGSTDYDETEGQKISDYQNTLLAYNWEVAEMDKVLGKELWRLNKYGNSVVEMIWDRRIQKLPKKEPVFKKKFPLLGKLSPIDRAQIVDYKWVEKDLTIADWCKLISYDMKDSFFDCMIDETQDQSMIGFRMQKQLGDIWDLQYSGEYKNVGKITKEHMYQGEGVTPENVKGDRQGNAGEIQDSNLPNGLFDVWRQWVRLPINSENGKWEPEKVLSKWHLVTFIGDMPSGKTICVQLDPNPNSCGQIPVNINHALEDDKGAFHLGFQDLTKSYLAMEMTMFDMALDNCRVRNRVPLLVENGSLIFSAKKFTEGGNQIITYKAGTQKPQEQVIQDTTNQTVPLLSQVDARRERVQGTGPAFRGEAIGGRQSASGYLGTLDQAMKPAVEDAQYISKQLLPFVGFWVKEMWSDFGDPERKITVVQKDEVKEVKPKYIWGDLKVRITSIKNFQDNALKRKEMSEVLTQLVPVMIANQIVSADKLKPLFKQYLKERHVEGTDEMFDTSGNVMSMKQAHYENMHILWGGGKDMPQEGDDDKIHIKEHEAYLMPIELLQPGQKPLDENIQTFKQHIAMHKYNMQKGSAEQSQPGQPQQQQAPQGEMPSTPTPGEANGDALSAGMGDMGNSPAPDTGRTAMIEGMGGM
jgi:hypothetical protein